MNSPSDKKWATAKWVHGRPFIDVNDRPKISFRGTLILTVSAFSGSTVTFFPPPFPPFFGFLPFGPSGVTDSDNVRLNPAVILVKRSKLVDISSDEFYFFWNKNTEKTIKVHLNSSSIWRNLFWRNFWWRNNLINSRYVFRLHWFLLCQLLHRINKIRRIRISLKIGMGENRLGMKIDSG